LKKKQRLAGDES